MAAHGAVLLPYSYTGAGFVGKKFRVRAYGIKDSSNGDLKAAAQMLRTELAEIHKHWPGTPVVVIGHSNGGFVSMDYWAEARAKGEPLNADLVMSLDSPINGVKTTYRSASS